MTNDLIIYLSIIAISSFIIFLLMNKINKYKVLYLFIFSIVATILGLLSTLIWGYLESKNFGTVSYFGAVFLLPIFIAIFEKIFLRKHKEIHNLDLIAILCSVTLVVMKIRCYIYGCCFGRILYYNSSMKPVVFPSQIAEAINGFMILIILLIMFYKKKNIGKLYLYFMLFYGISRFILNFFRYYEPLFWNITFGQIWGLLSALISLSILLLNRKKLS